ncbi:MAG TPA: ABC transporter substrate-binding protein [Stellaceae bacterium]|nr:ABC transporter substrate-binding protein [Stellaceae bacterium]
MKQQPVACTTRRTVLAVLAPIGLRPYRAIAQAAAKRPVIGGLYGATEAVASEFIGIFLGGMRDLGYVEGRDFDLVNRFANGQFERLPGLANELIELNPAVIVTPTGEIAAFALRAASKTVPIVSPTLSDPVRSGLVASFARPGGNVTGISNVVEHLSQKYIELALLVLPGVAKIGILLNLDAGKTTSIQRAEMEEAAAKFGVQTQTADAHVPGDLEAAFRTLADGHAGIVVVGNDGMFVTQRQRINALAAVVRLPCIYPAREFVADGGLISYGTNLRENFRRAAVYVVKILKGASPADLPVEFPTKLELVINLKTAKTLGITIPPTLLARADEVIE